MSISAGKVQAARRRATALLVVGLLLLPYLRARAESGNPDPGLAPAAALVRKADFAGALSFCLSTLPAVQDRQLKGRLLFLAGYCEFQLQRYDEAPKTLREASHLYPELSFHGLFYAALSYQKLDNYADAVRMWEKLIKGGPPGDLRGRAFMELMRCQRKLGNARAVTEAMAKIRALPFQDPAWENELTYTRGWARAQQGASAEAREILVKLWKEKPDNFWAGQAESFLTADPRLWPPGAGCAFTESERLARIQVALDRSLPGIALPELAPFVAAAESGSPARLASLLRLRGLAYQQTREYQKALADFTRAQSLLGSADLELTYLRARCLHLSGKSAEALAVYQDLWQNHPGNDYATRSLYYGARLLKLDNNWEAAEAAYRKLAADYPDSSFAPEAHWEIAWMRYLRGDYQTAGAYLAEAPPKADDNEFNARTLYWRSVVLHKLGDHVRAVAAEDKIFSDYWKSPYAFYLVTQGGRSWPYGQQPTSTPTPEGEPPLEFKIARELYALGIEPDAQGQLLALEKRGQLPEWMVWAICDMYNRLGDYYRSQVVAQRLLKRWLKTPPPGANTAWRLIYPQAFPELVAAQSAAYGLDPFLVWSVMRAESFYQSGIVSHAGAIGLMQIMPGTGQYIARELGETDYAKAWLYRPEVSIRYGCFYLRGRMNQFDGGQSAEGRLVTVTRALAAYNAGPERVARWCTRIDAMGLPSAAFVEEIPIKETREYVKRILAFYLLYHLVWLPDQPQVQVPQVAAAPAAPPSASAPGVIPKCKYRP